MYLLALALVAAQQAAAPAPNSVTVTGPEEAKICRHVGPGNSSATRISRRRVCLTPSQWRERGVTAGADVEGQLETLDEQTRIHSTAPTSGLGAPAQAGALAPR